MSVIVTKLDKTERILSVKGNTDIMGAFWLTLLSVDIKEPLTIVCTRVNKNSTVIKFTATNKKEFNYILENVKVFNDMFKKVKKNG